MSVLRSRATVGLLALMLVACQTASPVAPVTSAVTLATPTRTMSPSPTRSATPSVTPPPPSPTPTPTPTPSPVPELRPLTFTLPIERLASISDRNAQTLALLAEFDLVGVEDLDFSADSQLLATSTKTAVAIWNLATGQLLWQATREPQMTGSNVLFSPDGGLLALSTFSAVDLFDVRSGQSLGHFDYNLSGVSSIAFSANGKLLGVGGAWDGAVDVRDIRTGQSLALGLEGPPRQIMSVAFSPDNQVFTAASNFGYIRIWKLSNGKQLRELAVPLEDLIGPIVFSRDGANLTVVAGGFAAAALSIERWDVASGKQLTEIESLGRAAALSSDGRCLATVIGGDQVELIETATGHTWYRFAHGERIDILVLSPDTRVLAVVDSSKAINLYGVVVP